ncbi:MAG: chemotaxis protein CheD [Paracoccaceae bacterium]|nr:chemotaxis protein CheD [Paracoccaceae bacterium]
MKIVVGIADMKVSNKPADVLVTYSLGSCIGVVIWDPKAKVGGLLHYMLPDPGPDKAKAQAKPFMFAVTGVPALFKAAYALGADKSRLVIKVVGGSQVMDTAGIFNIGKRNYEILIRMFSKNNIAITKEDIGGNVNRTVSLEVGTGRTMLKVSGRGEFEL